MARTFYIPSEMTEEFEQAKERARQNIFQLFEDRGEDINSKKCQDALEEVNRISIKEYLDQRLADMTALFARNVKAEDN